MPRPIHLVIIQRRFATLILTGAKTKEIRLAKSRRVPFGLVEQGDRLYFKVVSGPVVVTALAQHVQTLTDLTPNGVRSLAEQHAQALCVEPNELLDQKQHARYATIVTLADVRPVDFGPSYSESTHPPVRGSVRDAWRVLPASCEVHPACLSLTLLDPRS